MHKHFQQVQEKLKTWYNWKARQLIQELSEGEQVSLLLPDSTQILSQMAKSIHCEAPNWSGQLRNYHESTKDRLKYFILTYSRNGSQGQPTNTAPLVNLMKMRVSLTDGRQTS